MPRTKRGAAEGGRLRIGDDWNAISIIALSQQSPLKAVAELVENSIDAKARNITITRGREKGENFLRVADDGEGIPRNERGLPDFQYVATHICDSLKRQLRKEERQGIQGEFGIGLLSFWTLGEALTLVSGSADGHTYEMRMRKGDPRYTTGERRRLFPTKGTEVLIKPLLPGIRHLSGEKIQWYLSSELRDRIRQTGVRVRVVDHQARATCTVTPREFAGRLLHQLPAVETIYGDIYFEIYLLDPAPGNRVGLYRRGTRVLEDVAEMDAFDRAPWTSDCLQGIVDAPFLTVTPGTRSGILHDERLVAFCSALEPVEKQIAEAIEEQQRAAEERASREILRSIHRAFREALIALPAEEYDWFEIPESGDRTNKDSGRTGLEAEGTHEPEHAATEPGAGRQKEFFEFPGPLSSVAVSPASSVMPVGETKNFRSVPRDQQRRAVEENLTYCWEIAEGTGNLENATSPIVSYRASMEPGLTRLRVRVAQGTIECSADALVTVTDELMPTTADSSRGRRGLPAYTFQHAPGELWRSRYEEGRNLIAINNAHRDFVYASRNKVLKLRYICRLYMKELVHSNFPGLSPERLLERMVELSLYTEEHLR